MPGGLGGVGVRNDDEGKKLELRIQTYISEMDEEIRDRFKALKSIQDDIRSLDDEEEKGIRGLERQFETKYKEIYALREQLINGKIDLD